LKPAFTRNSRRECLARLQHETFDVLILGGGINGAGVARDLALRDPAMKIGLVEQRHFSSGTSGKNSQLIHGGLRYLKNLEIGLVRESLHERATLLEIAPHLVKPLRFLIPMYGWFPRFYYGSGLYLYDALAGGRNVGSHRGLSRSEALDLEPGLAREGLTSAAVFYDCLIHSARFVLENLFDAARAGAAIVNYCRAGEHKRLNGAYEVDLTDVLSGRRFVCRARKLIDATGPWSRAAGLRLVRGSHVILPRLTSGGHAIAYFEEGGRIIFVIPWGNGDLSLVGTTDVDHDASADDVSVSRTEVDYLMSIVRRLFPQSSGVEPVSAYSSLRPLLKSTDASPTKTSREHRIWESPGGVLHIAGGKYTTYRAMSEEAAGRLSTRACLTRHTPLGGNTPEALAEVPAELEEYGVLAKYVRQYSGENGLRSAKLAFAVEHEMVECLPDLLFISTYWGYETPQCIPAIGEELGRYLNWDRDRTAEEIRLSRRICALPE
jgi:glycerol-3-phosphate dehydrogenase